MPDDAAARPPDEPAASASPAARPPGTPPPAGVAGGRRWLEAAFGVTLVVCGLILVAPAYTSTRSGPAGVTTTYRSLLEVEGSGVALILLIPVVLCAVPLFVTPRHRRRAAWSVTAVLGVAALAGLASVGLALVPTLILLAVGAARSPRH